GRGLDSGVAGRDSGGRECRWRLRGSATIGSPPMVEHVSPDGFLGGVLFGALGASLAAYLIWGKGRNATKVQLLAAQANEAAAQASERATLIEAAQDRAEYERKLAATRTAAEKDREQDRVDYEEGLATAREGYHRARAEATWRSLSVGRTDWHDFLPSLTDGRLAEKMD